MRWRRAAGKTGNREVAIAPEEVHRAALAAKTRPELVEYPIGLEEHPPETVGVLAIVGAVNLVLVEADRMREFVGFLLMRTGSSSCASAAMRLA
jgi:hypothetical protein